jgi:hypothetical protein
MNKHPRFYHEILSDWITFLRRIFGGLASREQMTGTDATQFGFVKKKLKLTRGRVARCRRVSLVNVCTIYGAILSSTEKFMHSMHAAGFNRRRTRCADNALSVVCADVFHFDNSYSWLSSKKLSYLVEVSLPDSGSDELVASVS